MLSLSALLDALGASLDLFPFLPTVICGSSRSLVQFKLMPLLRSFHSNVFYSTLTIIFRR
jgi:hypothetical protein